MIRMDGWMDQSIRERRNVLADRIVFVYSVCVCSQDSVCPYLATNPKQATRSTDQRALSILSHAPRMLDPYQIAKILTCLRDRADPVPDRTVLLLSHAACVLNCARVQCFSYSHPVITQSSHHSRPP